MLISTHSKTLVYLEIYNKLPDPSVNCNAIQAGKFYLTLYEEFRV